MVVGSPAVAGRVWGQLSTQIDSSTSETFLTQSNHDKSTIAARRDVFLYSALAGFVVAVVVAVFWYILDTRERAQIESLTAATSRGVETLIKKDIEGRVALLSGFARRWEQPTAIPRPDWEAVVRNILETQPAYQSIAWLDTSMNISWILRHEGSKAGPHNDLQSRPHSLTTTSLAHDRDRGVLTTPMLTKSMLTKPSVLVNSDSIIEIYQPVYLPGPDGRKFDGFMSSVLLIDTLLKTLLSPDLMAGHVISVSINGQAQFSTDAEPQLADQRWIQQRRFELYGLDWQFDVIPKAEFLLKAYYRFSSIMLTQLMVLSSLMALTVYSVLNSRGRGKLVRDTARRLDRLFKNLPGISYRCQERYPWPMEFVSDGCKALCGYEQEDLETHLILWGELIHPDDRERVMQLVSEAVTERKLFNLEYRIRIRAGAERWVWDRGGAIVRTEGQVPMLEGFITDITDRKHAELALVESRAYSEAIVDTAVEAVITIDANGSIETFNRSAEKMFGYCLEDVRGENVNILMPEPYHGQHAGYLRHYLTTGEARVIGKGRDVSAKRKDGSVFPIHLSVSEVHNQAKRTFVGLIRDVSEQNAAECEAREHREKLAHVDRLNTLGEMATGIAHEINQPLTAISLFSQAGKRLVKSGKEEKLPDIFDKLSQHALRAGAIIERMQSMTRQHMSTQDIVECNSLIKEVASLAEADARIRDIVIDLDLADGLPLISVDIVQIQQVTLNLLRNGMQAMQSMNCARGDAIKLQTRLREEGVIEVAVIDSGCGVSESAAENLFEPFSTTKESGMGMGLSICRAIVLAHGGEINFNNNDSGGATFYFTLPASGQGEQHG